LEKKFTNKTSNDCQTGKILKNREGMDIEIINYTQSIGDFVNKDDEKTLATYLDMFLQGKRKFSTNSFWYLVKSQQAPALRWKAVFTSCKGCKCLESLGQAFAEMKKLDREHWKKILDPLDEYPLLKSALNIPPENNNNMEEEGDEEEDDNPVQCQICYDHDKNLTLIPCGHTCCKTCGTDLADCPFCRTKIQKKQSLFL